MSNVIGPIDLDTWRLMGDLKKTLEEDAGKEEMAVANEKNTRLLKYMLSKYSKAA